MNKESILKNLKEINHPIIIFGASDIGQLIYEELIKNNIKIACFCDNNMSKQGDKFCSVDIVGVDSLQKKYPEAIFIISCFNILSIVQQLKKIGYNYFYGGAVLVEHYGESIDSTTKNRFQLCREIHNSFEKQDNSILNNIDLIITEKCSLKCKNCCNLMQFYENPQHIDFDAIKQNIDRMCELFNFIAEVRILGGEPFMNKKLSDIIAYLINKQQVQTILIFTNATIMPSTKELKIFNNEKVTLRISDYGIKTDLLNKFVLLLLNNDVQYNIEKVDGWQECSTIKDYERTVNQLENVYINCCAKELVTILRGHLYICPFIANGENLKAIPFSEKNSLDINNRALSDKDMRTGIIDFIYHSPYFEGCKYCQGRPLFGENNIPPAIQIKKNINYNRHL